jgi:hypothetical protein
MRRANLLGQRFGRLVVVALEGSARTPGGTSRLIWRAACDCGREHVARGLDLSQGRIRSCGCLRDQKTSTRFWKHGRSRGGSTGIAGEYQSWADAKKRCVNPRATGYRNYGGRGIRMCESWLRSFEAFYADMGPRPKGHELDRIDVNGHYEPGNCRWIPRRQQFSNLRKNRFVEFEGERLTVMEASRRAGISPYVVYGRLNNGWSVERALTEPVKTTTRK